MRKELERGNFPDSLLRMVFHFEYLSKKSVDKGFRMPKRGQHEIHREWEPGSGGMEVACAKYVVRTGISGATSSAAGRLLFFATLPSSSTYIRLMGKTTDRPCCSLPRSWATASPLCTTTLSTVPRDRDSKKPLKLNVNQSNVALR
ncbi:hypothetical protein Tco_0193908 [Tanacetum coccineum]